MASSINHLSIVLSVADKELRDGIKRSQKAVEELNKTLGRSGRAGEDAGRRIRGGSKEISTSLNAARKSVARFSEAVRTTIVNLRFLASAFAGGALTSSVVKFGGEFEKSLANINTLLSDNTVTIEEFDQALRRIASQTPKQLLDLSNALYQILSAGVPAADAIGVLDSSVKLAVSSISEVKDSANLLITTLNAYRESGLSAADATDKLTQIYKAGRTTVGELSVSFGRVAPLAAQFGVDLDTVGGLLISLTRSGLRTNEAITATRAIISGIAKPTEKTQKLLEKLNISFGQGAIDAFGFAGVMKNLLDATGGNVDVLARLFPNIRALLPAIVAAGSGFSDFEKNVDGVRNSFGVADESLSKLEGKFFIASELLRSNFQNTLVEISNSVLPVLLERFNQLSDFLQSTEGSEFADSLSKILVTAVKVAGFFGELLINAITAVTRAFDGLGGSVKTFIGLVVAAKVAAMAFNAVATVSMFATAGNKAGLGFIGGLSNSFKAGALATLGTNTANMSAAAITTAFAGTNRVAGVAAGIASFLGKAISMAFRFLAVGATIFFAGKLLLDAIFGDAEREARARASKARRELEAESARIQRLLDRLEVERRGGTEEQIEERREQTRVGSSFELSKDEAQEIFPGVDRFQKEAGRIITGQELFRELTKKFTKEMGEQGQTAEGVQEAQVKALQQLEVLASKRLDETAKIIANFRGEAAGAGVDDLKALQSEVSQAFDEQLGKRLAVARKFLSDARGASVQTLEMQGENEKAIEAFEKTRAFQSQIINDIQRSRDSQIKAIEQARRAGGATDEQKAQVKEIEENAKQAIRLIQGVIKDSAEVNKGLLKDSFNIEFNDQDLKDFQALAQVDAGDVGVERAKELKVAREQFNEALAEGLATEAQITSQNQASIDALKEKLALALESGDTERINAAQAELTARGQENIRIKAQQRVSVLKAILPLAAKIGQSIAEDVREAIKRNNAIIDFINKLKASLKAGKAIKTTTTGTGRAIDYNKRLTEALLRLKERIAKLDQKNNVSNLKNAVQLEQINLNAAKAERDLLQKNSEFYGRDATERKRLRIDQQRANDRVFLAETKLILARQELLEQQSKNELANVDLIVKKEEDRLKKLLKGNARSAKNRKKIEKAVADFRKKVQAQADNAVVANRNKAAELEEKLAAKARTNLTANQKVIENSLSASIKRFGDLASEVAQKIEVLNSEFTKLSRPRDLNLNAGVALKELEKFVNLLKEQQGLLDAESRQRAKKIELLSKEGNKAEDINEQNRQQASSEQKSKELSAEILRNTEVQTRLQKVFGKESNSSTNRTAEIQKKVNDRLAVSAAAAKFFGKNLEGLPVHLQDTLERLGLINSEMARIRDAASVGVLGQDGGIFGATTTGLSNLAGDFADVTSRETGALNKGAAILKEAGSELVDFSVAAGETALQIGAAFADAPLQIFAAADEFALRFISGLDGIATGNLGFVTDAAQQFALSSTQFLGKSVDLIGSRLGLTIGSAFGESGEGEGERIGGVAGTALGLAASTIISGALTAVNSFVISPIQSAVSAPFDLLSSGISDAFSALTSEGALSETAFDRRMELLSAEHAMRVDMINEEADKKASQIDEELALTQDIGKIQELAAKREEVRADRDDQLLQARRETAEKERSLIEEREKSSENIIQRSLQQALDMVNVLVKKLPELAVQAVLALTDVLPKLILGAAEALGKTLQEIGPLMKDLISGIVKSLIEALPFILEGATAFVIGLVEGIIEGFIQILENIDGIVGPLIQSITRSVPKIIAAVIRGLPRIVFALIKSVPLIVFEVAKGLGELIKGIFRDAGKELIKVVTFGLAGQDSTGARIGTGASLGALAAGGTALLIPGVGLGAAALIGLGGGLLGAGIGALASLHDGGMIKNSLRNPQGAALLAGLGAPGFATGGMVDRMQNAMSGSRLRSLRKGIDDVPAVLQAGEAVLNRRAVMNLGEETIMALNAGATPPSSEPTNLNVNISPNPSGLSRVVSEILPFLIGGVNAEFDRPGSAMRINAMTNGGRPLGTMRPRRS